MSELDDKMTLWQAEQERKYNAAEELISSGNAWDFISNPEALRILFNDDLVCDTLWVDVGDLGTLSDSTIPPLHIQVRTSPDGQCDKEVVIHEANLIEDLINCWGDPNSDESSRKAFDRAYAALQGGIDRLRAYEAECLKAQS